MDLNQEISKLEKQASLIEEVSFGTSKGKIDFSNLGQVRAITFKNCNFEYLTELEIKSKKGRESVDTFLYFENCIFSENVLLSGNNTLTSFKNCNFFKNISFLTEIDQLSFEEVKVENGEVSISNTGKNHNFKQVNTKGINFENTSPPFETEDKKFLLITHSNINSFTSMDFYLSDISLYEVLLSKLKITGNSNLKFQFVNWDTKPKINEINISNIGTLILSGAKILNKFNIENNLSNNPWKIFDLDFLGDSEFSINGLILKGSVFRNIKFLNESKIWAYNSELAGLDCYSIEWPNSFYSNFYKDVKPDDLQPTLENFRDMKSNFSRLNDIEQATLFYNLEMEGRIKKLESTKLSTSKFFNEYVPIKLNQIISDFHTNWFKVLIIWITVSTLSTILKFGINSFDFTEFFNRSVLFLNPFYNFKNADIFNFYRKIIDSFFIYSFLTSFRRFKKSF